MKCENENKIDKITLLADDTIANANRYGVVKLSDSTSATSGVNGGTAATPTAVKAVKDRAEFINGNLSNQLARVESDLSAVLNGGSGTASAPKYHASPNTTYGVGAATLYGHVKLSDSISSTSGVTNGTAATPSAVKAAYDRANEVNQDLLSQISNVENNLETVQTDVSDVQSRLQGKAPIYHAFNEPIFGLGSEELFGHVKLSDATDSDTTAADGIAATPAAVKAAHDRADEAYNLASSNSGAGDGDVSAGSFHALGSNFSVRFEWDDGNPDGEDRTSRFVRTTGEEGKIEFADFFSFNGSSFDAIGVTTSSPGFTVNNYGVDVTEESKAWANVAMLGPVVVQQDGSLIAGKYCAPDENGIATDFGSRSGYLVLKIIDDSTAVILSKTIQYN